MIAVVIFSVVVLSLAGLSFQIAKRSTSATNQALKMAAQKAAVDKAATVPYDSMGIILTSDTSWSSTMQVICRHTVDSVSATTKVDTIVTSTTVAGDRPDTIVVTRGRTRYPVPLK